MKNLPIKLFEKRKDVDDRLTEGGGSNELPSWALISASELRTRAEMIGEVLNATSDWLEHRPSSRMFIPAVLRLHIHDKAIAKSHRASIESVFGGGGVNNIIGMVESQDLLVKINSPKDVTRILKKIAKPSVYQKGIAAILDIHQFEPEIAVKYNFNQHPLRASLINYQDFNINSAVCTAFEEFCKDNNIAVKRGNYSSELFIYRVDNITRDSLEVLSNFEALSTLSEMPRYSAVYDSFEDTQAIDVQLKAPVEGKTYPIIGLLDSGIEAIPHLAPWIIKDRSFSKVPDNRSDKAHGTFVAGIMVYGDELQTNNNVGLEGAYLFDARVIGIDEITEDDLLDHIKEAISANSDIKVWNLSLGSKEEAHLDEFSYFGITLDEIQRDHNVLICKSAGNCKNFLLRHPVSRISRWADSVLALVVGSIAQAKSIGDLAEVDHPSPFSRIGAGPAHTTKPELTHYGGNAGIASNGKMVTTGVKSFGVSGNLLTNIGTSFSTPRVTGLVAGLHNSLAETFDPLLLKALAIHSARYPSSLTLPSNERIKYLGYGVPGSINDILFNDPHEVTLILQDSLSSGNWIQMLDFPYPEELIRNGRYYGEITVTLVTLPMLVEGQGSEYCQSNIDIRLGTHHGVKSRDGQGIRNPIGHTNGKNILHPSLYGSAHRKGTGGGFSTERTLLQYGDKFHPIKKFAVNLDEMTATNSERYLSAPKQWYLDVEGLFRSHVSSSSATLSQDYCLIITIRDSERRYNIYDSTTNRLNERGFVHSNINIANEVRVRVSKSS